MRAHNAEHLDSLPILDVSALKHIAYVFDALIYYMRSGTESPDADVLRDGLPMENWNDQVKKVSCVKCLRRLFKVEILGYLMLSWVND
jgi:E3 ubiquitin-protein ligase EDD1